MLLQLKLSTGVLVPSAGLAAATAWDRPADELQQLPPPISCRHDCAPPSKSTECRTNFPPNWRRIELPVLGQHFIVEMFLLGLKFHLNCFVQWDLSNLKSPPCCDQSLTLTFDQFYYAASQGQVFV